MSLAQRKCVPCEGGTASLKGAQLEALKKELDARWKVIDEHHLEAEFTFKDFREALEFTNKVGQIAEQEGHHPDIALSWGRVRITLYTHAINGLSDNDFILAAKIDRAAR